jgi:hypothetical protein
MSEFDLNSERLSSHFKVNKNILEVCILVSV